VVKKAFNERALTLTTQRQIHGQVTGWRIYNFRRGPSPNSKIYSSQFTNVCSLNVTTEP